MRVENPTKQRYLTWDLDARHCILQMRPVNVCRHVPTPMHYPRTTGSKPLWGEKSPETAFRTAVREGTLTANVKRCARRRFRGGCDRRCGIYSFRFHSARGPSCVDEPQDRPRLATERGDYRRFSSTHHREALLQARRRAIRLEARLRDTRSISTPDHGGCPHGSRPGSCLRAHSERGDDTVEEGRFPIFGGAKASPDGS